MTNKLQYSKIIKIQNHIEFWQMMHIFAPAKGCSLADAKAYEAR